MFETTKKPIVFDHVCLLPKTKRQCVKRNLVHQLDDFFQGSPSQPNPPKATFTPPEIAGLMIRAYENPLVSLNKALLKPNFLGGVRK